NPASFPLSPAQRQDMFGFFQQVDDNSVENPRGVTALQYAQLKKWEKGDFVDDWHPDPGATPKVPAELDRGPLTQAAGFPLAHGWEAGKFLVQSLSHYLEPFRFDPAKVEPGDVTQNMTVPWQNDIGECGDDFWPANRPSWVTLPGGSHGAWFDSSKSWDDLF